MDHKPGVMGATQTLNRYWLTGKGLARWAPKPHPWTTLYRLLLRYIGDDYQAKGLADEYYFRHFGYHPNSDIARVAHGRPPRGKVIGRG